MSPRARRSAARSVGTLTAAALVAGLSATARAQSIIPSAVRQTIRVGESVTVSRSITLARSGATEVDVFLLADNTGSMGDIIGNARSGAGAILAGLPDTYRFGVGRYVGDPSEGVAPNLAYVQNAALDFDKGAAQAGINRWFASGGGDTPEGNFFALQQVATTAGWRPDAQRLLVWFGDAPSHSETTTQDDAISALRRENVNVVAFNRVGSGSGIDADGQASAIVDATGGSLVDNFGGLTAAEFVNRVTAQIGAATLNIDLLFGSTFTGSGLSLAFACTDARGCDGVGAGDTRTFDLRVTGLRRGTYNFDVFAQGVGARGATTIAVVSAVPEPSAVALLAAGLVACTGVARRRRAS